MANVSSFSGAMPVIPGGRVQVARVTRTSDYSVSSTTVAGAADIFSSPLTFVADGSSTYVIEFNASGTTSNTSGAYINVYLTDGTSTTIANIGTIAYATGQSLIGNIYSSHQYVPSAGTVTLNARAAYGVGAATLSASTGSSGNRLPASLTVYRLVNQNDGLKPFWTPPVVTSLPSQATVGDQVIYAADATNGVYWLLSYDGLGTYPWKFIGGAPLYSEIAMGAADESTTSTSYVALTTAGPSVALPLPGDYDVEIGHRSAGPAYMSYDIGATTATDADGVYASANNIHVYKRRRKSGLTAVTLTAKYKSTTGGSAGVRDRSMTVYPVRVKAA